MTDVEPPPAKEEAAQRPPALERRVEGHAKRLRRGWEMRNRGGEGRKLGRRDSRWQQERRNVERATRKRTVTVSRWLRKAGASSKEASAILGASEGTLKGWEKQWRNDRMKDLKPRGRPVEVVDRDLRNAIVAVFCLIGAGVGLPTLQNLFPEVPRAELENLQARYRRIFKKKGFVLIFALRWMVAGRAWAMDYMDQSPAVDGIYPYILVVRDLMTGKQLLSLPTRTKDGREVVGALRALFAAYGPPLVFKFDNGSEFKNDEVLPLLAEHGVFALLSPPGLPMYNGAVEAGVGSVRTRAHHEALRNDRPGEWTCDDVEAARLQANETARPRGIHGPTPDEAWAYRGHITSEERSRFREAVRTNEVELRRQKGPFLLMPLGRDDQERIDREAITKAMVDLGLLEFRRRRISVPFFGQKQVKIS